MSRLYPEIIKQRVQTLRKQGLTYSEIQKQINYLVPKNTFTGWFKNISLSDEAKIRIVNKIREGGAPGRVIAWQNTKIKREELLRTLRNKVEMEVPSTVDLINPKICLAMLYLGDGSKTIESIRFGNSDPKIIQLFLFLLRQSFQIDERKLRGRLQCRADQDIQILQIFWSNLASIPISQFHKFQVDKRTIGVPTLKTNYKGVFVVEYASNEAFLELKFISDIIYKRIIHQGL